MKNQLINKNCQENISKVKIDSCVKKMTRKQAIQRTGLMAISAATMIVLLGNPSQAQTSPSPLPGGFP